MRHSAEGAQGDILLIRGEIHVPCLHRGKQLVRIRLALAAADDLADARHQEIGRRNRLAVRILLHIEGLDLLGIVDDKHGLFEHLLGDIALVLRLQIAPPFDGELELLVRLLQNFDRLGIVEHAKLTLRNVRELVLKPRLHELIEERDLLGTLRKYGADEVLDHLLGDLQHVRQLCKRDLRFNVPELGKVTRRVGVLRAEGGTEGVDPAQRRRGDLTLQLTGHRKPRLFAKEVVLVVRLLALVFCIPGLRRHAEHLARALAVARGDEGRVDIVVAALMEIAVYSLRRDAPHAKDGGKRVGTQPQMRDAAQKVQRRALLLNGVFGRTLSKKGHFRRVELRPVPLERFDDDALCPHGRAALGAFGIERKFILVNDDLQTGEARPVRDLQKGDRRRIARRTHPAADGDLLSHQGRVPEYFCNIGMFHLEASKNSLLVLHAHGAPFLLCMRRNTLFAGRPIA